MSFGILIKMVNHLKISCKCCDVLNTKEWQNWVYKMGFKDKFLDMDYFQGVRA